MIYVDEPQRTNNNWCHMASKFDSALHLLAYKLGLKRSWFQDKPEFPHYDLSPAKRRAAIQLRAKAVTNHQMVEIVREWRAERDYFEKVVIFIIEKTCPTCEGFGFVNWDPYEGPSGAGNPCPQCVGARTIEVSVSMTQAQWDAEF